MRWSKLRALVENRFDPEIRNNISISSAAYGSCSCGHLWITIDKKIVANFCTRAFYNRHLYQERRPKIFGGGKNPCPIPPYITVSNNAKYGEVDYGEMSRQGAYSSCWEFIHTLHIDNAISSDNPLIQSLAVLDKRVGQQRLIAMQRKVLHPLFKCLLDYRLSKQSIHTLLETK